MAEKFGKYSYEIIKTEKKDELLHGLSKKYLFDRKANIHGICIELLTDNKEFKEMWEDNFYYMSDDMRPHGRIVAVRDELDATIREAALTLQVVASRLSQHPEQEKQLIPLACCSWIKPSWFPMTGFL